MKKSVVLITVLLWACMPAEKKTTAEGQGTIRHAKRFTLQEKVGYKEISIFGDRAGEQKTSTFILANDTTGLGNKNPGAQVIRIPCKKIAALSSIYAAMICELGGISYLEAIDNIDYINNRQVIEKHRAGQLRELAKTPDIDLEQTLRLKPDIVFSFGMGYNTEEDKSTLRKSAIPIAVSVDHLESSPLGRAEWIKFFAAFLDRDEQADSIFNSVEKNYLELVAAAKDFTHHPTVFSETKYGDVWYMPGGKSFMATLLRDAAADYLWKNDDAVGSLPLTFEQVYAKAREADYWLNLPMIKSRNELLANDARYSNFKAFREDHIYNNTRVKNDLGYSNYWETGMIYPDRILADLVEIFHGNKDDSKLTYYEKLR